jgi:hypothetical protein
VQQQPQAAAGQVAPLKWAVQPPSGSLQDWLQSVEVEVQVSSRVAFYTTQGSSHATCSRLHDPIILRCM